MSEILNWLPDKWMSGHVTHIKKDREGRVPNLYLTFDDGPDPHVTEKVLRLLERHKACASFFVIVKKALAHPDLILEMKSSSHAVGNHSWDHSYWNYFLGKNKIKEWIQKGEDALNAILLQKNIGFRSPAGIRTPALHLALKDLGLTLILWNVRFFDTQIRWTTKRALAVMDRLTAGDIILLHDCANRWPVDAFLHALAVFIEKAQERGFCFKALGQEIGGCPRL